MEYNLLLITSVFAIALTLGLILIISLKKARFPYQKREFLMNIPERKFFEELKKIIPEKYTVFPQVSLSSIVSVNSSRSRFWEYHNKINRKTIDFVIFETPYYKPVIAIEYDGKTHEQAQRKERDTFVTKVLENAEIKILHIKHQKVIDLEEIKKDIESALFTPLADTKSHKEPETI